MSLLEFPSWIPAILTGFVFSVAIVCDHNYARWKSQTVENYFQLTQKVSGTMNIFFFLGTKNQSCYTRGNSVRINVIVTIESPIQSGCYRINLTFFQLVPSYIRCPSPRRCNFLLYLLSLLLCKECEL
jgi:hypothetical protein